MLERPARILGGLAAACLGAGLVLSPVAPARQGPESVAPAAERYEIVDVVDGDTIRVSIDGAVEKLRLLSVDTEEKISGRPSLTPDKPETVFGQETTIWARRFFAELASDGRPARIGLRFPGGRRHRDAYGRLLCHVILPDGRDFNVLLVRLGKSPYFNKYGNSLIAHAELVAAQAEARAARRGIWDPRTNVPADPEAPSARRAYERLLPWWQARADAVEGYRRRHAADPDHVLSAEEPDDLVAALERGPGRELEVFGEIERFFEEEDGSLTALLRSDGERLAVRAVLPRTLRNGELERRLRESTLELRQNYLYVQGRLVRGPRGARIILSGPRDLRPAGPEPE